MDLIELILDMLWWIFLKSWFFKIIFPFCKALLKEIQMLICVFRGILSLVGALVLVWKSGFHLCLLFQMSTFNKVIIFVYFWWLLPPMFLFNFSSIVFLIFPGVSVCIWVLSWAFSYMLENYPIFVQHLFRENLILPLLLVSLSFCLPGVFTLQQRLILLGGGICFLKF